MRVLVRLLYHKKRCVVQWACHVPAIQRKLLRHGAATFAWRTAEWETSSWDNSSQPSGAPTATTTASHSTPSGTSGMSHKQPHSLYHFITPCLGSQVLLLKSENSGSLTIQIPSRSNLRLWYVTHTNWLFAYEMPYRVRFVSVLLWVSPGREPEITTYSYNK